MSSKSRLFSQLAQDIDSNGNLNADAFSAEIVFGLDSADITNLIDSDYVLARVSISGGADSATIISLITSTVDSDYVAAREADAGGGGGGASTGVAIAMTLIFG